MSRWFRVHDDLVDDPKVQLLAGDMVKALLNLWCLASQNDGLLPSMSAMAFKLRMKPQHVAVIIAELSNAGLIDREGDEYRPHNWDKRQYRANVTDPTNATRQKRYREKHRNAVTAVTDKRPETESDTEQNRTDTRDDLQKRVGDFRQAIVRTYAECNSPALPDTSRAQLWLTQGYDPEICLAVIASIVPKKPNVSLGYFENAIKEAHESKAPARRFVNGAPPINWDVVVSGWKKYGRWSRGAGNDPTSPACQAPSEILRKYGIEPLTTQ